MEIRLNVLDVACGDTDGQIHGDANGRNFKIVVANASKKRSSQML